MEVTKGVFLLDCAARSHVYLIRTGGVLIDTGMPGGADRILRELKALDAGKIEKILLTHHDVDHIGNAKRLQERTGAELWASAEDIPFIKGEKNRPGVKRVIQSLVRPEKPTAIHAYGPEQHFGAISVIKAPGHTPGHVIFSYRDVLFSGDLFRTIGGKFQLMPQYMNWDQREIAKSVAMLRNMEFRWVCPSHGRPLARDAACDAFLSQF